MPLVDSWESIGLSECQNLFRSISSHVVVFGDWSGER